MLLRNLVGDSSKGFFFLKASNKTAAKIAARSNKFWRHNCFSVMPFKTMFSYKDGEYGLTRTPVLKVYENIHFNVYTLNYDSFV